MLEMLPKTKMLFFGLLAVTQLAAGLVITLPDGQIEGIEDTTRTGTKYYEFLAVRYAEPPVGELRFKPPQSLQPWEGIYDATSEKNICYQVNQDSYKENEDCLFANVYTPADLTDSSLESNLTVMVWIHGGGFISGAAYQPEGGVGPKFFMDANVVFVAINYRLGPFGFMTSGDELIQGNLGLKDQAEALRWVQKNIAFFGGDPEKVTIFGQSAGSASVSYQLLNPHAKGLFRGAILESGAVLSPWAYQRNQTEITYRTAQLIDPTFTSRDSSELLQFLQSVPAASIDNASALYSSTAESVADYQISKGFFYGPVIEVESEEAVLTDFQYGLLRDGTFNQVPVLAGITNEESLGLLANGDLTVLWNAYNEDPSVLVPFDLHITDIPKKQELGQEIWEHFTKGEGFNLTYGIKYHSIHDFDKANIKQAELISQYSTTYFYQFSYSGLMGYTYRVIGCGNVSHAEEVQYFFSKWLSNEIPDNTDMSYFPESDQKVHYRVMSLWTNFAKYLNPTPVGVDEEILENVIWEPITPTDFKYLDIGADLVMTQNYPKKDDYLFWTEFYEKNVVGEMDTF